MSHPPHIPPSDDVIHKGNFPAAWQDNHHFTICETEFGLGLNFLKLWTEFERTTNRQQKLHYYACAENPCSRQNIEKYFSHLSDQFGDRPKKLIADYPLRVGGWHTLRLSPQVTLTLIFDKIQRALPELVVPIDSWITTNPDHPLIQQSPIDSGTFQHHPYRPKKIAVIGGGIAGASLAYFLSARKCDVTIFEKDGLASGGSGNNVGICNPRITAHRGPEADFFSPAFNLALRVFKSISNNNDIGFNACGCLHLMIDEAKEKRYQSFADNWGWHADHAQIIDPQKVSEIAGISLPHSGLYLPDAGMISPKDATIYLAQPAKIVMRDITTLEQSGTGWIIDGEEFEAVILTGAADVLRFPQTQHLPLEKIRGQVTHIQATDLYSKLKTNLSYGGYASVPIDGIATLGSTFQKWLHESALRPEDDIDNLSKLEIVSPALIENLKVIGGRAAFRCAANDRSPVIGQMNNADHLYISTAHGSHGILSSIMGAEFLTAKMMGDTPILPKSIERFLSPNRFKKKQS